VKRLVIVADHSLVVEAIRLALRQTAGFQIVGYIDGRTANPEALAQARPDIVLVDDMNQPAAAVARIGEVHEAVPAAQVLLLTLRMDADWLDDAMDAGANAIICKAVHPVSLGNLVREIASGNVYHRLPRRASVVPLTTRTGLTNRELEILKHVAGGASNGHIAQRLWVTEQTVKLHLSNIYRKLGVSNRTEAAHFAHTQGLLVDERPERMAA
jgi:DNA-binding NarL/FixJ family response regulator